MSAPEDEIELEATWLAARNDLLSSAFDVLVFLTSTFVLKSEWLQNASDAGSALLILGAGMSIVLRTIRLRQQLALSAT